MPQTQLPVFPASSCAITPELAFEQREGVVVYFNGHLPVFAHPAADLAAFRLFSSQLIANGRPRRSRSPARAPASPDTCSNPPPAPRKPPPTMKPAKAPNWNQSKSSKRGSRPSKPNGTASPGM